MSWQQEASALKAQGLSGRYIATLLGKSKSAVNDYLSKQKVYKDNPIKGGNNWKIREESPAYVERITKGKTHLYIPDSQIRPDVSFDFLGWIGEYIVRKRPDVIIHAGDFADMESLSSYDKGKRTAEGKRVQADIDAAVSAMEVLLAPLRRLQQEQEDAGEEVYRPRMVLTLGNHENRIDRHVDANPELHGYLSTRDLRYEEFGWEVVPYLTPIIVDGIAYCHFFPNVMTGKPLGGSAANMLKTIGCSFTQGHKQTLDVTTRFLPADGKQQWGVIAGACYTHDESYKGVQGNHHWRGIILKHNVRDGSYDPLFVSLDWLQKEYDV